MSAALDGRVAARGAAALLVLQTVTRTGGLLFVLVVTRHVAPADYSRYSVVAAVVLIGGFLADFGTTSAITRLVSAELESGHDLLRGTLLVSLGLGGLAYAGAVGFAVLAGYRSELVADVAIGALALPLTSVAGSVLGVLDGVGRISTRGALNAAQSLVMTIGGAGAVLLTGEVRLAIVAVAVAPAVALIGGVVVVRRAGLWDGRVGWDRVATSRVLRLAVPIAISGGITALSMRVDVVLLSVLSTARQTASYDLAVRSVEAWWFIALAVAAPLLPILASRDAAGDREGVARAYRTAMRAAHVVGVPISVLLATLGTPVARVAFGSGYGSVGAPLAVLGAGYLLQFRVTVQGVLAEATAWLVPCVRRAGVALAVMVTLDLILIPRFGADGAAWATVASSACFTILLQRLFARDGLATPAPPARLIAAGAAMAAVAVALRGAPWLAGGAGVLVYVLVLAGSGEVRRAEVVGLLDRLRRPAASPASALERSGR